MVKLNELNMFLGFENGVIEYYAVNVYKCVVEYSTLNHENQP